MELLLLRTEPPCARCLKAEALLREVAAARPGVVTLRVIRSSDPEAQNYAPVLTPMVLLNGKLLCAGISPLRSGLERLVDEELNAGVG